MFTQAAGDILERGLSVISANAASEKSKITEILKKIAAYPVRVVASFLAAPFLVFKIAMVVENPVRRVIAIIGLLVALLLSYAAGTTIGTMVGFALAWGSFGFLTGVAYLIGTTLSVYMSVVFAILVFNAVSFVFLKVNTQEVLDYLHKTSA